MGLRETAQKLAATAFKAAGNIVLSAAYEYVDDNGFDDTDPISQNLSLIKEQDGSGKYVNRRYVSVFSEEILATDVVTLTPTVMCDYPIVANAEIALQGQTYTVKEVATDSADALYVILLRRI